MDTYVRAKADEKPILPYGLNPGGLRRALSYHHTLGTWRRKGFYHFVLGSRPHHRRGTSMSYGMPAASSARIAFCSEFLCG
jgi:hypothetical protein